MIGWPAPTKAGTAAAHGAPLGADEVRATKLALGLDPDASFDVPEAALEAFASARRSGAEASADWRRRVAGWREAEPAAAAEWDAAQAGEPLAPIASRLPRFDGPTSTRSAGGETMAAFADLVPTMVGGSADLAGSTKTQFPGAASSDRDVGAVATSTGGCASTRWAPPSTGWRCTAGS